MGGRHKKIKVMALVPSMRAGGAERVISLLLQQLDRKLFETQLTIVFDREVAYAIPEDTQVVVLEREPAASLQLRGIDLPEGLAGKHAGAATWMDGIAAKLGEVVLRQQPDVIVSSPMWASIVSVMAHDYFPPGTRLISRVDAPPSVSLAAQTGLEDLFTYFVREHFHKSDRIVAVSRAVGRDLVKNFGVDPGCVEVVSNPVDIVRIHSMMDEPVDDPWFSCDVPVVVFVGRLERVKGIDYLLRAIALLPESTPARCALVGEGSQRGYLVALCKHLGILDRVRFVGRQPNPFKYVRRAGVFVLPSLSEGMPNVLLEAMVCGCPVIASDIAGGITREVLNEGDLGLIVPREDEVALASSIVRMLSDASLRHEFAVKGLDKVREYDLPKIMRHNQALVLAVAKMKVPEESVAQQPRTERPVARRLPSEGPQAGHSPVETSQAQESEPPLPEAQQSPGATGAVPSGPIEPAPAPPAPAEPALAVRPMRLPSDKIRLCVVVPDLDDEYNGAATTVLLNALDRDRFEVSLINVLGRVDDAVLPEDVEQHVLAAIHEDKPASAGVLTDEMSDKYHDEIAWMSAEARGLASKFVELQADVVFAQGFYASILATMAQKYTPWHVVTLATMRRHAADFADTAYRGDLYLALIRNYFNTANRVLAPDASVRADLVNKLDVDAGLISVVPDPIDTSIESARSQDAVAEHPWFSDPEPVFLCVAEPDSAEGLSCLVRAVALANKREAVRCLVIGCEEHRRELSRLARQLDVAEVIDFLGEIENSWTYMHDTAAVVHSGVRHEMNVPAAVVDAVALCRPVISTKSGDAILEFLGQGERGVLVPMKDSFALADAMLQVVWDDDAAQEMVRRAAEHLDSVSADTIVPVLEELVEDLGHRQRTGRDR